MAMSPSSSAASTNIVLPIFEKETNTVDMYRPLRNYVAFHYSEREAQNLEDDLQTLKQLRYKIERHLDPFLPARRDVLQTYFKSLCVVEKRFPISPDPDHVNSLTFVWFDAFKPKQKASQQNIHLEKAAVLFNLGAVYNLIGCSYDRSTVDGRCQASQAFISAAGSFAFLRDNASMKASAGNSTTVDLSVECAGMLEKLMLAQAQECVFENTIAEGSTPAVCAKISRQVGIYYEEALAALNVAPLSLHFEKSWIVHVQLKAALFYAEACYRYGLELHDKEEISEEIARLRSAINVLIEAKKRSKGAAVEILDAIGKLEANINQNLERAVKENGRIYLMRVPSPSSLPPIPSFSMVKPLIMNEVLDASKEKIFSSLVLDSSAETLSRYSEMVNDVIRTQDEKLQQASELTRVRPKELNPYLKDSGSGYPEEKDGAKVGADQLLSSSLVGDGGASWRLKALKRSQEQAARERRNFNEVVQERWGSLGELTASVASNAAAPARAHLRAIKNRQKGITEENSPYSDRHGRRAPKRDYVSSCRHEMRKPKVQKSLSWGERKSHQHMVAESVGVISAAISGLNKFPNDGSFMQDFVSKMSNNSDGLVLESVESEEVLLEANTLVERSAEVENQMSANQLAAKVMQLRLKGKNEEAEKLMQEVKVMKENQDHSIRSRTYGSSSRYAMQKIPANGQKKGKDDADMHLALKIMQNKKFSISTHADDGYDFEDGPSIKSRKKQVGDDSKTHKKTNRFLTQQERCHFCLENPNRSMHLVVSIANFTYLMLPQRQPVVPGHCCILPIQHESATRTVDDNVWTEIRNFKKCLIMMFAKQKKEVVFLETVMGLAQQQMHCMIECIPLSQDIAKEAPLYFKKAIDEAEDEWSQHNAKKLIDTSNKGLRNSIPNHFPYFHVEFGLNKGFVHIIDDEKQFNRELGLNVVRGLLHLAEEDMYRPRRHEAVEVQKQAVASFSKDWNHFDWTKQLHET